MLQNIWNMDNKRLEYIDQIARDALGQVEVPYQPADWAAMEARIDKDAFLKTRLYWLKGGELILMLVTLWLLLQFVGWQMPGNNNYTPPKNNAVPAIQEKQPESRGDDKILPEEEVPTEQPKKDTKQTKDSLEGLPYANKIQNTKNTQENNTPKNTVNVNKSEQHIETTQSPVVWNIISNESESTAIESPAYTNNDLTTVVTKSNKNLEPPKENKTVSETSAYAEFTDRIPVKYALLDNHVNSELLEIALVTTPGDPVPTRPKKARHLRIAASPDMNMTSGGYNMGLTAAGLVGVELTDKWKFETGVAYSAKMFKELFMNPEQYPNLGDNYSKNMDWHALEIPAHIQYTIKQSTNWRPFINAGMTAHAVMMSNYSYQDGLNTLESPFNNDREAAILQGGKLSDNLYATVDFGLGLERQLDKNLHLFIQPTYKYALNHAGIHRDKVHTFSLVMGARTAL